MRVLVAYATAQGSTRGVAERIASVLRERGLPADCLPVDQVSDLQQYDAVVVGSALHSQAWLPEAATFVTSRVPALTARAVWLFSVGMPGALARPLRRWAMREGPMAVAPFEGLVRARGSRLFSGVVSKRQLPLVSRAVFRLMGGSYGDFRDWEDIESWAAGVAGELGAPSRP
jgi:menaquinone-dependent protoporphyrinogen oxidase